MSPIRTLALRADYAAAIMFVGMTEGWFRADRRGRRQTLARYFGGSVDDPVGAREIINGDKSKIPSWSGGVSIGNLIKGYHIQFLAALEAAAAAVSAPPVSEGEEVYVKTITITSRAPIQIVIEEE